VLASLDDEPSGDALDPSGGFAPPSCRGGAPGSLSALLQPKAIEMTQSTRHKDLK